MDITDYSDKANIQSMELAASWFNSNQNFDGSFPYQMNTYTANASNNNDISRSAFGLYALTLYYSYSGDLKTKNTIINSIEYFKKNLVKKSISDSFGTKSAAGLSYNNRENTGGTIALILALTEYGRSDSTSLSENRKLLDELGINLLSSQNPDGSFRSTPIKEESDSFTNGQGIIGLVEMYRLTKDTRYLNAAKKSADFVMIKYRDGFEINSFYTWGVIGLYKLYQQNPDERYWVFIKQITEKLWLSELESYEEYFRKEGVHAPPLYLAVYLEGLAHTTDLARTKDPDFYNKLKRFIDLSLIHLRKFQINNPYSDYRSSQKSLTGSYCFDYSCKKNQIDLTAHNLSALYHFFRLLKNEK